MCACPKPVPGCSTSYMSCSFYDKNWRWNVIFRFVNISGICQSRVTNTCIVCSSSVGHCIVCSSSVGHYIVCPSLIDGFSLPFGIFKLSLSPC
jgi:hypothetical protein